MQIHTTLRALAGRATPFVAAALLLACGGGSAPPPSTAGSEAMRAAQPGELVAYFRTSLATRNAQGAWPLYGGVGGGLSPLPVTADETISGTILQEAGVDEDDLLKTDGSTVYSLHPGGVAPRLESRPIRQDGSLGAPAGVALDPQSQPSGMYLAEGGGRIAVVGSKQGKVSLDTFNVSGGLPAHATQVLIDGYLVSTRRIGNVLYIASTWTPDLSAYWFPPGTPAPQIEASLAGLNASTVLPTIRVGSAPAQPLVEERDCRLQPASASLSLQLTTITAIDLSAPALERRSVCFVGNGDTLYMSTSAAYVATSRNYWLAADIMTSVLPQQTTTDIHKFALRDLQVSYRGSAEIPGHLGWDREKTPYRMSEHQGNLRVLTFTGSTGWVGIPTIAASTAATSTRPEPASPATLTVLREASGSAGLVQVAQLPNRQRPAPIGHEGEQVYAVHFAGPLAYVVTFRRTDPLYVLDLSDPADPKPVGELAIPGYSDYLFPLANGKLLGVGRDATESGTMLGLKIALFDVTNPALPALLSSRTLGDRGSSSTLDFSRHGINIYTQGTHVRIALPVELVTGPLGGTQATQRGLARFVVDTAAGTLEERAMVPAGASTSEFFSLAYERSIQAANATYYLSGGQVRYIPQP